MEESSHIIYGIHGLLEALETERPLEKIWVKRENSHQDRIKEIRKKASQQGIPVQYVPEVKLQKLCGQSTHQGVVAQASPISFHSLEALILEVQEQQKKALFLMLDGVTDVRNFGAIARTASCMGVHGIIVPQSGSASVNAHAVKSSAGALHHIPICRVANLIDALLMCQSYEILPLACTEKAENNLYSLDLSQPLCLIMGAEDKGISQKLLKRIPDKGKIPISGPIGSLNVSVATGIALAEISRQRS